MTKYIILAGLLLISCLLWGQEADVDKGCVPLLVTFSTATQATYYWDFGDNSTSNLQNPSHNYTTAGDYTVILRDNPNGAEIGQILITVFPELTVDITSDNDFGCIPLPVNFSSNVRLSPGLMIDSINWTLGDGEELLGSSISHTYNIPNVFDISLQLYANIPACNKIVVFEDVIEAEDLNAKIMTPEAIPCSQPATTSFSIDLPEDSRYTYTWDFGNGQTATGYDSGNITFDTFGEYIVTLTIDSPSGCSQTSTQRFRVGGPIPLVELPDTVCIGETFQAISNTIALRHEWMWGDTTKRIIGTTIPLTYYTPGLKEIEFKTYIDPNCPTDTIYTVYVELPDANARLFPTTFCSDEEVKIITANNSNYAKYIWNDVETTSSTYQLPPLEGARDSLYINVPLSIEINLMVESNAGCTAEIDTTFVTQIPEAYFLYSPRLGYDQLDVTFRDFSASKSDIVRRTWIYGNGDTRTFTNGTIEHSYLYDTCGIYYPKLVVENIDDCIDTSKSVAIEIIGCGMIPGGNVTGQDTSTGVPSPIELYDQKLCVNDLISIKVNSGATQYHIGLDNDILDHCWTLDDTDIIHQLRFPGTSTPHVERYWKTLLIQASNWEDLTICGARAVINYTKECADPFNVVLRSESMNATSQTWLYEGNIISTDETFSYRFDQSGTHIIELLAQNDNDPCDPDKTSVEIYVTQPRATFTLPEVVCDSIPILLDAGNSRDVMGSCYKGYLWEFEHHRPRETGSSELQHVFHQGTQEVSLTVTDINGCTAKSTESIRVLGINPDFDLDSLVCLPYPKELRDLSTGDTSIISWNWSFGSTEQNPTYNFDMSDIDDDKADTITVQLAIEDSFGCKDTLDKLITTFDPAFGMDINRGVFICQGDELRFFAIDTFNRGALFDFNWEFGTSGTGEGQVLDYVFEEAGEQEVRLSVEQKLGGCSVELDTLITVFESPVASFTSDKDGDIEVCYPAQIQFMASPMGSDFKYQWQFGTDESSIIANPTIDFGRGTHQVQLIVSNQRNCSDTVSRNVTLAGAEGSFVIDNPQLCLGNTAQFSLVDTSGVGSYIWDFGDGNTLRDQNPVSHTYGFKPPGEATFVTLFLESPDGGCNASDSIPIYINEVIADFVNLDTTNICNGRTRMDNLSTGADIFEWDFGNGEESQDENAVAFYNEAGTYTVNLTAIDSESGCESQSSLEVTVPESLDQNSLFPNIFSPNNDSVNDFFGPTIPSDLLSEIDIRTFRIYNRWGQLVYDNTNPEGWDGRFEGNQAATEVYGYYIELEIDGCDLITRKGSITLVR